MMLGWDGRVMNATPRMNYNSAKVLNDRVRESVEKYLQNMRRSGLKRDVRAVIDNIERQYRLTGWLSFKQVDVLRRCCIASNAENRMGGFGSGPRYGRNAPAGRRPGPIR